MAPLRVLVISAALALLIIILPTGAALAGEYTIATCQADRLHYSATAFVPFESRGMKVQRTTCDPQGPGIRGLVTRNRVSRGNVRRGAVAWASIYAPTGTYFTKLKWAGSIRRSDCRYAIQLWAQGPHIRPVPIKNVRANRHCPRHKATAQAAAYRLRSFNVDGATRLVQRVICVGHGRQRFCSARGLNYIRTYKAELEVVDSQAPNVTIFRNTPLAAGAWVSGSQPLNYSATDNVGVRRADAIGAGQSGGFDQRPCAVATLDGAFATAVPCPSGPGRIVVNTARFPEGTQTLVVEAEDTGGILGDSAPVTARVDNTAPGRVDVGVAGGEAWRRVNGFNLTWSNAPEPDRAPIVAAIYRLCAAAAGTCNQAMQTGGNLQSLSVQVPRPGQWTVAMWRRDAAGNQDPAAASVPVTLRYDPEPPQVAFEPISATEPTLISARVADKVSGLAAGSIEISRAGSNVWQTLATQSMGGRLLARINDAALPAGSYVLRATAFDQAHNETSTTQRIDGQPMTVTLPLRTASAMRVGVVRHRIVRRTVRRHGKRRTIRRHVTVLKPAAVVRFGRAVTVAGRLTTAHGQGIAGATVHVLATSAISAERIVAVVRTDSAGGYTYKAPAATSRRLRLVYNGSPTILPTQGQVGLVVPASSSLRVNHRRVLNGQRVVFSGRVRSLPLPVGGKLIQLEVRLPGGWQTFRTTRTDMTGRWTVAYRFSRTRGVQRYRFRVELPPEAGYPFATGRSRSVRVRVRGR